MEDFNAWCLPLNCSEDDAFSMMLFHGGNTTTTGIVNGLIHVMMYSYYQLALLGYTVWWKKYLTQMQIIQFVIVFIHNLAVFFVKSCNYGLFITLLTLVQAIYFIYMFTNFYLKTYRKEIKKN
ncbi:Elongation of very long chain fatty acids protein F [Gryllus bimaculatus]|nr:Elongation of very long chain fatty acids protein F [Gryllus bimaculatus]